MTRTCLIVEDQHAVAEWLGVAARMASPNVRIIHARTLAEGRDWLNVQDAEALTLLETAIVDIGLPDGSGIDLIRELAPRVPHAQVIVATIYDDDHHLFEALAAGARGYLLKDQGPEVMARFLGRMHGGEPPLSPAIARRLLTHFKKVTPATDEADLTKREAETLALLARGLTTAEVAKVLGLSQSTVATYVKVIYQKLNVSSRAEATLQALKRGLV